VVADGAPAAGVAPRHAFSRPPVRLAVRKRPKSHTGGAAGCERHCEKRARCSHPAHSEFRAAPALERAPRTPARRPLPTRGRVNQRQTACRSTRRAREGGIGARCAPPPAARWQPAGGARVWRRAPRPRPSPGRPGRTQEASPARSSRRPLHVLHTRQLCADMFPDPGHADEAAAAAHEPLLAIRHSAVLQKLPGSRGGPCRARRCVAGGPYSQDRAALGRPPGPAAV
jgi:hypothetical protein